MKKLISAVLSVVMMLSVMLPAASAAGLSFTDVNESDWFYEDVRTAVYLALVNGKSPTKFAPNDNLTYAEVVKLAACMNESYTTGKVTQSNAPTGPWYDSYVAYCKEHGIISQDYSWNSAVTRAGYMGIFAKALPASALPAINNVPDGSIPDVPMDSENADAIYMLYRAGILQGSDEQYNCRPNANIRRSEVAAILVRMMDPTKRKEFSTVTAPEKPEAPALVITEQPKDINIPASSTGSLTVKVSGGTEPYSYQWFTSTDNKTFVDLPKDMGTSQTVTLQGAAAPLTVYVYCVITDANGSTVKSDTVKAVTVAPETEPLTVIEQPKDTNIPASGTGIMTVKASGGEEPYSYQWFTSTDNKEFVDLPKDMGTFNTLTLQGAAAPLTVYVYCVITDANGSTVKSDTAKAVTIAPETEPLQITQQPKNLKIIPSKDPKDPVVPTLSVTVTGGTEPYTYKWQASSDKKTWKDVPNGTNSVLRLSYSISTPAMTGYARCVITDASGNSVITDVVTITVGK